MRFKVDKRDWPKFALLVYCGGTWKTLVIDYGVKVLNMLNLLERAGAIVEKEFQTIQPEERTT
jgi:hypothetical protein